MHGWGASMGCGGLEWEDGGGWGVMGRVVGWCVGLVDEASFVTGNIMLGRRACLSRPLLLSRQPTAVHVLRCSFDCTFTTSSCCGTSD